MQLEKHEKRRMEVRRQIREWIAFAQTENKTHDEELYVTIWTCVRSEFVEELKLTVNVPRSSVELCLNDVKCIIVNFLLHFLVCAKICF